MAAPTQTAHQQQDSSRGLIGGTLSLPFKLIGILLFSLLVSLILEYVGIYFFWPEQGWRHSQAMLEAELDWLSDNFKASLIVHEPVETLTWLIAGVYEWLFVKTGFVEFAEQARIRSRQDGIAAGLSQAYLVIEDYALATLYVTLIFLVRLLVLVLAVPLFLLAIFTGVVDGLMRRDLRRFGAGRESSFIYHRAKACLLPLLVAPWLIYLALPISVNPALVLLPCAAMLGVAFAITAATFKKYL